MQQCIFHLLAILAACVSLVSASITYRDTLSNILNGKITPNNGVYALIEYISKQPYNCDMDISMASLNNGEVMKDAIEMYEDALAEDKWGDALFFKHFILYNGQAHDYLESSDLRYDLAKLLNGNETMRDIWTESSTNDQLKELYRSISLTPPSKRAFVM